MSRAKRLYLCIALILFSGCATTNAETDANGENEESVITWSVGNLTFHGDANTRVYTFPNAPHGLRSYLTDNAFSSVSSCPVQFVNKCMGIITETSPDQFDLLIVLGIFTPKEQHGPLVTVYGQNKSQDGVELPINEETSWEHPINALVHEYLHAYYYLKMTEEERTSWKTLWKNEMSNCSNLLQNIQQRRYEQSLNNAAIPLIEPPHEMWAHIGEHLVTTESALEVPSVILECYRGILRDEFLDSQPQTTSDQQ